MNESLGREPFGGPFNGQLCRQQAFRELMSILSFSAVVETGTFTGSTTEFMARESGLPVWSVELDAHRLEFAQERLAQIPGVRLELGDSRCFLEHLAVAPDFPKGLAFFYLDAHWRADLPLRQEVSIILANWNEAVVMIDDFCVPDDHGYGYDKYENDQILHLEYLRPVLPGDTDLYFPRASSGEETGARRGCVLLLKGLEVLQNSERLGCFRKWAFV